MNEELLNALPPMLSGDELLTALSNFPPLDKDIDKQSKPARLIALSDLYNIYVPSKMSLEIYSKLYLAMLRSMQKKQTKIAIRQSYENHRGARGQEYNGIIGGADSFTIIGVSGIGKSTAINRALNQIANNQIITLEKPYCKIIPCMVVQCPFDCSVKGLLLEVLRKVDEVLDSNYYNNALRARATIDMLIGSVSQVALNHIGLLIVDEIQNVVNSKNGKTLIGALTQLINNSGISIGMIGTPECEKFFESALQLARRSVGLKYGAMPYDLYFETFCKVLLDYQYVHNKAELTAGLTEWLYEHSAGITSVVVSLMHDAQETAILTGRETLDLVSLNQAYEQRLNLLHSYIEPSIISNKQVSDVKPKATITADPQDDFDNKISILSLVQKAKSESLDIVDLIREHYSVTEVKL